MVFARRAAHVVLRLARFCARALADAAVFSGTVLVEIVAALVALYSRRRDSPASSSAFQARLAANRRRHNARWQSWNERSLTRRLAAWATLAILLTGIVWIAVGSSGTPSVAPPRAAPARALVEQQADRDRAEENAHAFDTARAAAAGGTWIFSKAPVVPRGPLGAWDDFKVDSPALLIEQSAGLIFRGATRYRLWYRGCHLLGIDYACAIGSAESSDGVRWTKAPAPAFAPGDRRDRARLGGLAVIRGPSRYEMWFAVEPDWTQGRTHATLQHATSADATSWKEDGPVLRSVDEDMSHHLVPEVLYSGGTYHLWYTDRLTPDGNRVIVHSTSSDGRSWTVAGGTPLSAFGDQDPGRLSVAAVPGGFRAWFAYNPKRQAHDRRLGTCASTDGSVWTDCAAVTGFVMPGFGAVPTSPIESDVAGSAWLLYAQHPANGADEIALAVRKETT